MAITFDNTLAYASQINQLYSRKEENEVIDSKLSSIHPVQAQTTCLSKKI